MGKTFYVFYSLASVFPILALFYIRQLFIRICSPVFNKYSIIICGTVLLYLTLFIERGSRLAVYDVVIGSENECVLFENFDSFS